MKRNIEDLVEAHFNQTQTVADIVYSFEHDYVACLVNKDGSLDLGEFSLLNYKRLIAYSLFSDWKGKGRCAHFDDFLKVVSYESLKKKAPSDIDSFLLLIEVIYNCYMLVEKAQLYEDKAKKADISRLKNLLDSALEALQYKAEYDEEKELVHIVPITPEASKSEMALAPHKLKEEIAEYTSSSATRNLKRKREILFNMGNEYEPKVKQLEKIYPELESAISFLLNKMNVRHNNKEPGKYYCEKAATLSDFEQELIYDRLYNLLLLAFMIFENQDRLEYVEILKRNCKKKKGDATSE